MASEERDTMFDEYFDSIFKDSNVLTKDQFEKSSLNFQNNYASFLPQNKESKILDIGCGCGHFLYFLKKQGYQNIYGVDISPQQVSYCKENVTDQVEVVDSYVFLEDKKEQYDCISMVAVLEHIPKEKMQDFLKRIYGSLKKGGTFLAAVPNMNNPFSINLRYRDFTHEVGFTEISLKQVMWTAGFREIQMAGVSIHVCSFKSWVRALLVKILWRAMRFCYYIQDFAVPEIMSAGLIGVAKK